MATPRKTRRKTTKRGKERRSNGRVDKALQNPKRRSWIEINNTQEWFKAHTWNDYGVTWL